MNKVLITRLTLLSLILLMVPIIIWVLGWHWQQNQHYASYDYFLFIITETGSAPLYALISSLFFATVLVLICKNTHWSVILLSVFILQAGSQVVKTAMKTAYKEPRPYMSYMIEQKIDSKLFYEAPRTVRKTMLQPILDNDSHTPSWLKHHWQNETGYSFPSGHTAFAVTWLLIFAAFMLRERRAIAFVATTIMTIWALLMLISRIRLGMHYPIDLFVSTVFVCLLNMLYFYILNTHKAYEQRVIKFTDKVLRRPLIN